jgi:2-haloacid dehalogenase
MALFFCHEEVAVVARSGNVSRRSPAKTERWVTFDCFGTLVDWQAGFVAALRPLAGAKAPDVVRAYHVHERLVERELPHRSYKDVLVTALMRAAADHGVAISPAAARALPEAWLNIRPFDDVEAMLAELRLQGWRLAVLTNCDEDLFLSTHRMFRAPFDFVLTAERVRGYKPAPWHFRGFERLMGMDRGDWVHVACSWYHDIAPAQALGIQHVWLDRDRTGESGVSESAHVHSAAEVASAVERVFRGQARRMTRPAEAPAYC